MNILKRYVIKPTLVSAYQWTPAKGQDPPYLLYVLGEAYLNSMTGHVRMTPGDWVVVFDNHEKPLWVPDALFQDIFSEVVNKKTSTG